MKKIIKCLKFLKRVIYTTLAKVYFKFVSFKYEVLSIEESISIAKTKSIIRLGDGEIALINGKGIVYQGVNDTLTRELYDIFLNKNEKVLVCLPDIFDGMDHLNRRDRNFHQYFMFYYRKFLRSNSSQMKTYGNTFLSRPYIIFKDKTKSREWFSRLKELWNNENICIIEGRYSKTGVNNDLFKNAKEISRVICPSENAYDKYDEIYQYLTQLPQTQLFLFALGPTSKVLINELSKNGYHCVDIGHLDTEYEWMKRNAENKIRIAGKHTAEFDDEKISNVHDENDEYKKQIIKYIE